MTWSSGYALNIPFPLHRALDFFHWFSVFYSNHNLCFRPICSWMQGLLKFDSKSWYKHYSKQLSCHCLHYYKTFLNVQTTLKSNVTKAFFRTGHCNSGDPAERTKGKIHSSQGHAGAAKGQNMFAVLGSFYDVFFLAEKIMGSKMEFLTWSS